MSRVTVGLGLIAVMFSLPNAAEANCGPGGVFKDNDYCISCAGKVWKENSCPGGEVGLAAEGVTHPNCSISYYSDATCRTNVRVNMDLMKLMRKEHHLISPWVDPKKSAEYNARLKLPAIK